MNTRTFSIAALIALSLFSASTLTAQEFTEVPCTSQLSDDCLECCHAYNERFCSFCSSDLYLDDAGLCEHGFCTRHHKILPRPAYSIGLGLAWGFGWNWSPHHHHNHHWGHHGGHHNSHNVVSVGIGHNRAHRFYRRSSTLKKRPSKRLVPTKKFKAPKKTYRKPSPFPKSFQQRKQVNPRTYTPRKKVTPRKTYAPRNKVAPRKAYTPRKRSMSRAKTSRSQSRSSSRSRSRR